MIVQSTEGGTFTLLAALRLECNEKYDAYEANRKQKTGRETVSLVYLHGGFVHLYDTFLMLLELCYLIIKNLNIIYYVIKENILKHYLLHS